MRLARLIFAAAVASAATVAFATPASATDVTIPLKEAHEDTLAADFQQECDDERFDDLAENEDGWHFVLPGGGSFVSVKVSFDPDGVDDGNTDDDVVYEGSPGDPGDLMFYGAADADKHVYAFTPAGWMLIDGEAVATSGQEFNLSHTCAGEPDPSPSPSVSRSASSSPSVSTSPSSPGDLPKTGSALTGLIGAGVVALVGGAALMAVRRRRGLLEG